MAMFWRILLGWYCRNSLTWDSRLCHIHHILLNIYLQNTILKISGHFLGQNLFHSKWVETLIYIHIWTILFVDFLKAFDSIHRGKIEQILLAYDLPKETVTAIIMLYKNTKVKVCLPDGDTDYFDIVAGVLQRDTLAPYLFIICLDYVLRTSVNKMKDNGFKLTNEKIDKYPAQTIIDADYADNIVLLANATAQAETLLHSLEWVAAGVGLHVNADKMEYMCFNQRGEISTLNGSSLKLVHLPRKQCPINRKRHRHAANKSIDSYR